MYMQQNHKGLKLPISHQWLLVTKVSKMIQLLFPKERT